MRINIKLIRIVTIALSILLIFTGCMSQKTYDELLTKVENLEENKMNLEKQNDILESEKEKLNKEITDLNSELDKIINGPNNLLYQARELFENNKYEEVITVATTLHENYNGSPEDIEGQKLRADSKEAIDAAERAKKEEEDRIAAEAIKSAQDKVRAIIRVTKLSRSNPNSAGGVDLFIGFRNISDKVIKYVTFTVTPYNSVGDKAYCDIRDESTMRLQDTGPYKKGEGLAGNYNWYWENTWYNWNISKLELNEIFIEYMDGTYITLTGQDVNYVQY